MSNVVDYTSDGQFVAEYEYYNEQIQQYLRMEGTRLPGMEGFFSRLWNSIVNQFKFIINAFSHDVATWQAYMDKDWVKYCEKYIKILENDPPSDEHFSSTVMLRATKQQAQTYISCLKSVSMLFSKLDTVLLTNDRNLIPAEMQNAIRYLESNKCKVNPNKPSESKAATRMSYGSVGRIGTAGYGSSFFVWVGQVKRNITELGNIYKNLANSGGMSNALEKAQNEIEKRMQKSENASDRERATLMEQINNIKVRMTAIRSIHRAAVDFFNTILLTVAVLPLHKVGLYMGFEDDLTSWIFSTNDD